MIKQNGIEKVYLNYHIEINNIDENTLREFFECIPPSSVKFLQNSFSFPFIQFLYNVCSMHPYFENCDVRSIKIKESSDELAVIFREKYYFLPLLR